MYENVGIGINFKKKQAIINKLQEKYSKEEILQIMSDQSIICDLEDGKNIERLLK